MNELVFEVIEEVDGGYCAECLTESIVTEGNSWDELCVNVRERQCEVISSISPKNSPSASASVSRALGNATILLSPWGQIVISPTHE
jgi:hypothetical protein